MQTGRNFTKNSLSNFLLLGIQTAQPNESHIGVLGFVLLKLFYLYQSYILFLRTDMEEVIGLTLAGVTVCVNAYAIFLCFAIYDYQDEKPSADKSPIDVFVKG